MNATCTWWIVTLPDGRDGRYSRALAGSVHIARKIDSIAASFKIRYPNLIFILAFPAMRPTNLARSAR